MANPCPTDAELRDLLLGKNADAVGEHLLDCPQCGANAGRLVASDPMLAELRAAHETSEIGTDGTFVEDLLRRIKHPAAAKTLPDAELAFLDPAKAEFPTDLGMFNHYRIVEKIGEGGMGMVFRAVDSHLQRTVALKIILPKYAANQKLRDRFIEEARATVKVRSPHVAEVYETNVWKDVPYLTMELLVGTTLDKKPKPMAVDSLRRIGFSIAKGLADAHRSGMIHRDLKPSNIHLGTDARTGKPTVKLIDFGLARPVNRDIEITKSGELLGTPAYMSPEQARGKKVDHRTDLYSLGVILHQLATGKLPYDSASEGVMAILTELAMPEPLTSVASRGTGMPPKLANLIDQLLAKDPANRPASADEVMKVLRESLNEKSSPSSAGTEVAESAPYVSISDAAAQPFGEMATEPLAAEVTGEYRAPRKAKWLWPAVGVGTALAALLIAIAMGAFTVKVQTKDGPVIELVNLPDDAEVTVDGEAATVVWDAGKKKAEVRVKPGTRTIEVKKDGFRVSGEEITLAEGDRKPFTVKLEKLELGAKPAAEPVAAVPTVVTSDELVVNGTADKQMQGWEIKDGRWNPFPANARDPFFRPGNSKSSLIQQDVPVSDFATDIDAGRVEFQFSGLISCYSQGQKDKARIAMIFLDADHKEIDVAYNSFFVHEPTWKKYGATRKPKLGTRYVRIVLHSLRDNTPGNSENSGYYDTISLKALVTKLPATFAKLPAGSSLRFFGSTMIDEAEVRRFAAHTSLVFDNVWKTSSAVTDAARAAGRPVVLHFHIRKGQTYEDSLYPFIEKHRDTVAGIAWSTPLENGFSVADIVAFGKAVKAKFPGLQFWPMFGEMPDARLKGQPLPEEFDGIVVTNYFATTPGAIRSKVDASLLAWSALTKGRPIVLMWTAWESAGRSGLVPKTQPGTFRALVDAAKKHGAAGVVFDRIGDDIKGFRGIESNAVLLKEIEDAGKELGFAGRQLPAVPANAMKLPAASPERSLQYFVVGFNSRADLIAPFAPSTNLLFASGLPDAQPFIDAARSAKHPLVLAFGGKNRNEVEGKLFPMVEKNRDVVAGICWSLPYGNGYTPADVAALGTAIKNRFPGLSYSVSFGSKPADPTTPSAIPPEVDLVVVNLYGDNTPEKVRTKTDLVLPDWIARANGRPLILRWAAWEVDMGLVPRTDAGTFRACVDAAKKHKVAGVAFEPIDDDPRGFKGIATNPVLAKEIEDLGRELGFAAQAPAASPVDRNRFNIRKGRWSIVGDELAQTDTSEPYAAIEFGDENWTDYDYKVDVKRVQGKDQIALLYRWMQPSSFGLFGIGTAGNTFGVVEWQQAGKTGFLQRFDNRLPNDEWQTLIVKVRGDRITCQLNPGTKSALSWDAVNDRQPRGKVGLRVGYSHARFRNIKVTAPDGTVLWEGLPNLDGSQATAVPPFTNALGMKFARVPKGTVPLGGRDGKPGTVPATVAEDFYLGTYEVTQEEWQAVMGTNPSVVPRVNAAGHELSAEALKRFPVNNVSWTECREFVSKLNGRLKETGWEYRLPTATEWEYACRGGPSNDSSAFGYSFYAGSPANDLKSDAANFSESGLKRPCAVGRYAPNRLGMYDMHGNVAEWCDDEKVPDGVNGMNLRANRGGGWSESADYCRPTWLSRWKPDERRDFFGLRIARVPVAKPKPLFNGKDLTGWVIDGTETNQWMIENGTIVGRSKDYKSRGHILSEKRYSDFVLKFEFQVSDAQSHGAVDLRAEIDEKVPMTDKTQIAEHPLIKLTNPTHPSRDATGASHWLKSSVPFVPPTKAPTVVMGLWHAVEVTVNGDTCTARFDGAPFVDLKFDPTAARPFNFEPGLFRKSGRVGFQINTGTMKYRNVEIRELTAAAAPANAGMAPIDRRAKFAVGGKIVREGAELSIVPDKIPGNAALTFGDPKWTDYDVEVDAKGNGWIYFRVTDVQNFWDFEAMPEKDRFKCRIAVKSEGKFKPVADAPNTEESRADGWNRMKVRVRGNQAIGYFNGREVLRYTDDRNPAGMVSLGAFQGEARYKNLTVTAPDGTVLFQGLPELPAEGGAFVPLFNGKDLAGWEAVGNANAAWKVEAGELVGGWKNSDFVGGSTLATTKKDYRHFRLKVVAKPSENWASRIVALPGVNPTGPGGYFKVWIGTEKGETGGETGRLTLRATDDAPLLAKAKVAADAWNTIEIEVRGNRVQVFVDGAKTADQTDDRLPAGGHAIGLHLTGGATLRIKTLEIEELTAPGTPASK